MFNWLADVDCKQEGIERRTLLQAGFLGLGQLSLAQWLRLKSQAGEARPTNSAASVIFVELAGGPSHFETYDPKPEAPREYRGPLSSIATSVAGVRFSELMPRQASAMRRLAIVRSIHHNSSSHETSSHLVQTGYYLRDRQNRENEMPCAGALAARMCGSNQQGTPAYVAIPQAMRSGTAAYLGKAYNPFVTGSDPNRPNFRINNLELAKSLSGKRLRNRRALLASLDRGSRVVDNHGVTSAMDDFTGQAFEMVTGRRAREAFDIHAEDPRTRDRYGRNAVGQSMLLARRLVEAGVTFVTVRVPGWDDHQDIKKRMRQKGPAYDCGMAALVNDLYDRGLDRDVLVVAMGEFGRTPRVNKNAGRDHWGAVMSVLLAGGGLRVGQIVGNSNRKGEAPVEQPYRPEHVLAMVYRHLGIDPAQTFEDLSGRPRYVLEDRQLIDELI
jgi:hypothetical protein